MWTASQLGRLMRCPASSQGLQVGSDSKHALVGTQVHVWLEATLGGVECDTSGFLEDSITMIGSIDLNRLPFNKHAQLRLEKRIQWCPETGAVSLVEEHGSMPSGQSDVIIVDGDHVIVADYKTGNPVTDTWQLKFNAFVAARLWNCKKATAYYISVPSMEAYGTIELGETDFVAIERQLKDLCRTLKAPSDRLVTGDHCTYCPRITSCPAMLEAMAVFGVEQIDNDHIFQAKDAVAAARVATARIGKVVWAAGRKGVVRDGRTLTSKWKAGSRKLDQEKVTEVIRDYGFEPNDKWGQITYTLSGLKASCKEHGIGWSLFLGSLQKHGAIIDTGRWVAVDSRDGEYEEE